MEKSQAWEETREYIERISGADQNARSVACRAIGYFEGETEREKADLLRAIEKAYNVMLNYELTTTEEREEARIALAVQLKRHGR